MRLTEIPRLLERYEVVSVDTESRAIDENKAFQILFSLGTEIRSYTNEVLLYKKVDSTLRGNIVSEIKALYDSLEADLIVFAPAYPKQGRTTVKGIQMLWGVPVEKTYFGEDVRTPVKYSDIPSFFESAFGGKYRHLFLSELRSGRISKKIGDCSVVSFDVKKDEDLRTIVAEIGKTKSGTIVWAGSTGLAEPLAYNVVIGRKRGRPILMAIGSVNDLTRSQLQMFIDEFSVTPILVGIRSLIEDYEQEYKRLQGEVSKALNVSSDVVLTTSYDAQQIREGTAVASNLGINTLEFGSILANRFGVLVSSLISYFGWDSFGGLILTGGDLAVAVMKNLGISNFEVEGELEPALPLLKHGNMQIVTKAGGFGSRETLVKMAIRLRTKS